jgi:neutral ceramidase
VLEKDVMWAGFAAGDITCPVGTPLGGNIREDKAARGVHDPLLATVAVLGHDGSPEIVLISLDLVSVPNQLADSIRSGVVENLGLGEEQICVFATHTHSGGDVACGDGFELHDYSLVESWMATLPDLITRVVVVAARDMGPVQMSVGLTTVDDLSFNRRIRMRDGTTRMNWEPLDPSDVDRPWGPIDPELLVLRWNDETGRVRGVLVHFALHPAILVGHDWLVSRDFVGPLVDSVKAVVGAAVPVLFANGALGDINHLDYRNRDRRIGFVESERVGRRLGESAVAALEIAHPSITPNDLSVSALVLTLNQRVADHLEVEEARQLLADLNERTPSELDGVPPEAYARWLLTKGQYLAPQLKVTLTIVTIGEVAFVFAPFEVFVDLGIALRNSVLNKIAKVISLANGYFGYLPTKAAFEQDGYETTFGTSTIAAGQAEVLISEAVAALRGTAGGFVPPVFAPKPS